MISSLPLRLRQLLDAEYPRFTTEEMARRRAAMARLVTESEVDHLIFCGVARFGSVVQWLTQWPVTAEAVGVFSPGLPDALFLQHVNHPSLARILAPEAEVEWGGESSMRRAVEVLAKRGARAGRIGVIGPLTFDQHAMLADRFGPAKSLNRAYARLRKVKSAEEIDWMRIGAAFSDAGMLGLRNGLRAGLNERALGDLVERAYVADGGTNVIHYIGITSMRDPQVAVPRQFPSTRIIQRGDPVTAEISAAFFDHNGQVLRSFAIGEEPSALYRDLHAAADAAFDAVAAVLKAGATPQQVIDAAGAIEDAGFTVIDDLLHGYGGGYLPPILGTKSRPAGPVPDEPFEAGQTVVIQPNVVTSDHRAGVQTGELVVITATGVETLHNVPRGFAVV